MIEAAGNDPVNPHFARVSTATLSPKGGQCRSVESVRLAKEIDFPLFLALWVDRRDSFGLVYSDVARLRELKRLTSSRNYALVRRKCGRVPWGEQMAIFARTPTCTMEAQQSPQLARMS